MVDSQEMEDLNEEQSKLRTTINSYISDDLNVTI